MKIAVARHLVKRGLAVNLEVGLETWGRRRADVLAMDFSGERITIVEIKSGVQDFRTDHKWKTYLSRCTQFYFCFTRDTWEKLKDEVPTSKKVGVFVLEECSNYWHYNVRAIRSSRVREIDPEIAHEIALRLAFRGAKYRTKDDVMRGGNKR